MSSLNNFLEALDQSKIRFNIPGADCRLAVRSFNIDEEISACFTLTVSLVSTDEIKEPENIVEKEGLLTVAGPSGERYFHGVINNFVFTGKNGRFYLYDAQVVPSLWFLTLNQ
ncbi:MAG: contractile injection system protein, VgrG/Pvc8 family, partial [Candidatus Vecturithrix sp.]|nr:contractile injection system protein, VgrG/Pvc8 family [Candidatus Vecturithrix sp.]